jgi:hypothetical protein
MEDGKYYYMFKNVDQNTLYYLIQVDTIRPTYINVSYYAERKDDGPWSADDGGMYGEPLTRAQVDAPLEDARGIFVYEPMPAAIGGRRRYRKRSTRRSRRRATRRNRTRRAH